MAVEQNVSLPRLAATDDVIKWARTLVDRLERVMRGIAQSAAFGPVFEELSANPPAPARGGQLNMYMKANKLVVHFVDAVGASHFFTLDLTAVATQSWVYSASAP